MKKTLFRGAFLVLMGMASASYAQLLDVDGDAILRNATPSIRLYDNGPGELRTEGELSESNDDIRLTSYRGDLGFQASTGGFAVRRMTINGVTGNVGINTVTPSEKLHVVGNAQIDGNVMVDGNVDVTGDVLFGSIEAIRDGGSNTIETNSSFQPENHIFRDLGGSLVANGWDDVFADAFMNISDIREKHDIKPMTYGLAQVLALNPISYILNKDLQNEVKLGLSAQELLTVVPEAVKTQDIRQDEEGNLLIVDMERYGVTYNSLIPVLINAVKELNEEIIILKKEIQDSQN